MPRINQHHRREQRQEEAQERLEASQKLSPQARLSKLDAALGEGLGAKKERARLTALLEKTEDNTSIQPKKRKKRKKEKKDDN